MSLHTLAHNLQRAGRNGDTMLVHMTADEVGGLQDLARHMGKSLTINPHTGLPEANIFSSAWKAIRPFAPMIAGAALAPLTAGTSLAFLGTPLGAAGLVGGGTALATGSLQKGLMAGLGAYGGAGIGAGLTSAGTNAAITQSAGAAPNFYTAETLPAEIAAEFGDDALLKANQSIAAKWAGDAQAAATLAGQSPYQNMAQGLQSLGNEAGRNAFMSGFESVPNAAYAGLGSIMAQPIGRPPKGVKNPALIRPYEYTKELNPDAGPARGNVWEGPVSSKERDYFTEKMTPLQPYWAPGPEYDNKKNKNGFTSTVNQLSGKSPYMYNQPNINPYTGLPMYPGMAHGGMADGGMSDSNLGDYSDGGRLLRGPGDGVSDQIPATIAGKQPARLANNEFVVPARIVSEIGNGSTDAGAKRLYAMMDRVQKRRSRTVGKGKIAVDSGAYKELLKL